MGKRAGAASIKCRYGLVAVQSPVVDVFAETHEPNVRGSICFKHTRINGRELVHFTSLSRGVACRFADPARAHYFQLPEMRVDKQNS
jgi:hypothetical protein